MALVIALLLTFVGYSLAGSECPPRENIYPCSCVSFPQGKRLFFTSVTCHRLPSTDSFSSIFPALRSMTIDRFYLYDSFWEASLPEKGSEEKQVLPADWLTVLKIKEIEIVDTTLSACFACNSRITCRNDITVRFTAVNSSSHDKICTLCDSSSGGKFSWTGCMNKLKEFHFRHGKLTDIRPNLFPMPMRALEEVDLSYNSITKIESNSFKNMPKLKTLKLSNNALKTLEGISTAELPELQLLDVSWNLLSTLGTDFFKSVPKIKTFIARNNYLVDLEEKQWKDTPTSLRTIDIRENPVHCDCNVRWINTTFHINTVIQGHCATPEDYENSLIRRASIELNKRCTEDGKIGTKKRTTKPPPTESL